MKIENNHFRIELIENSEHLELRLEDLKYGSFWRAARIGHNMYFTTGDFIFCVRDAFCFLCSTGTVLRLWLKSGLRAIGAL